MSIDIPDRIKQLYSRGTIDAGDGSRIQSQAAYVEYQAALIEWILELIEVGSETVKVVLPTLPANTWTNFPPPGTDKVIVDYAIYSSTGEVRTTDFDVRDNAGQLQIQSLKTVNNLGFVYEVKSNA